MQPKFPRLTTIARGTAAFLGFWLLILPSVSRAANQTADSTNWFYMPPGAVLHPTYGVGAWIWADQTTDQQTCRFWRDFEIPRGVIKEAQLRITADNAFSLYLDGREIAKGGEWRSIAEYDLRQVLTPGKHAFAIEAFNDYSAAGVLMGLHVEMESSQIIEIASDKSWRVVPKEEKSWEKKKYPSPNWHEATVIAALGIRPWEQRPSIYVRIPPQPPIALQFWQTAAFQIALACICGVAVAVCLRLMAKLAMQSKAQGILQLERARIARDIHDDLGAGLTQLVLLGEIAQNERTGNAATHQQFNEVSERARGLLRALNEAVWFVNSQRDTLRDFASYISKYAQTFLQATTIRCRFDVESDISAIPLDLAIRRNLFLAVKEAINNAVKHSQATELVLRIHRQEQNVVVVVEDDGKGFNPASADRDRNGLSNMQQRTAEAGGECRIVSSAGNGCRVEFTVPLAHPAKRLSWPKWRPRRGPSESQPGSPAIRASTSPVPARAQESAS